MRRTSSIAVAVAGALAIPLAASAAVRAPAPPPPMPGSCTGLPASLAAPIGACPLPVPPLGGAGPLPTPVVIASPALILNVPGSPAPSVPPAVPGPSFCAAPMPIPLLEAAGGRGIPLLEAVVPHLRPTVLLCPDADETTVA